MIDSDIIALLKSDATLNTLLSSSASNSKIFPNRAPQNTTLPFIAYSSTVGILDENLDEDRFQFSIVGNTKLQAMNIRDRLKNILDIENTIQKNLTSSSYYIYYSKLTGSDSLIDNDTDKFIEIMFFSIKYKAKPGGAGPAMTSIIVSETEPANHTVIWEKPSEHQFYIYSDTLSKWVLLTGF